MSSCLHIASLTTEERLLLRLLLEDNNTANISNRPPESTGYLLVMALTVLRKQNILK